MTGGAGMASADALEDITKAGTVKIGIFEDFPPFASLGSDMKIQGYDVDMAEKLAAKALGVKAELVGITGQNRIPFLTEGKVDCCSASASATSAPRSSTSPIPTRPTTSPSWARTRST